MASAFRVRQSVRENFLANRPYVSLWLGKTYPDIPGMWFQLECMQAKCGALKTLKRARNLQVICKCGT
eukprot:695946-Pelagomonas_calceolata.AAC.1